MIQFMVAQSDRMKVFLVEDSLLLRMVLRGMVAELGYDVIGESDSQDEALRGIEETMPDIVLLDLRLAQGNGVEVLRRTKTAWPMIRVMVLTNCSGAHYRRRCRELGADGFYDKVAVPELAYRLGDLVAEMERGFGSNRGSK